MAQKGQILNFLAYSSATEALPGAPGGIPDAGQSARRLETATRIGAELRIEFNMMLAIRALLDRKSGVAASSDRQTFCLADFLWPG
jgi:hypothetical protein